MEDNKHLIFNISEKIDIEKLSEDPTLWTAMAKVFEWANTMGLHGDRVSNLELTRETPSEDNDHTNYGALKCRIKLREAPSPKATTKTHTIAKIPSHIEINPELYEYLLLSLEHANNLGLKGYKTQNFETLNKCSCHTDIRCDILENSP